MTNLAIQYENLAGVCAETLKDVQALRQLTASLKSQLYSMDLPNRAVVEALIESLDERIRDLHKYLSIETDGVNY